MFPSSIFSTMEDKPLKERRMSVVTATNKNAAIATERKHRERQLNQKLFSLRKVAHTIKNKTKAIGIRQRQF